MKNEDMTRGKHIDAKQLFISISTVEGSRIRFCIRIIKFEDADEIIVLIF